MTNATSPQEKPITPPALKKGDLIAFLSPSNRLIPLFPTRLANATSFFLSHGFPVHEILTPLSPSHLTSLHQRASEIHSAFRDERVKAIICTIGGLSANELLPHLDYGLIRRHPKIFVGYSDITILHCAILARAGVGSFYGPAVLPQFGESEPQAFTVENFFGMVMEVREGEGGRSLVPRSERYVPGWIDWNSEAANRARETSPSPAWKWLRSGKARGRLVGGCLPSLVQVCGTKYMPSPRGKILLLETPEGMTPDSPFPLPSARAAMADLRNAGVLEGIVGLVVGRPFMYSETMVQEFEKMITETCYETSFPILARVDVGHVDPVLTLPLGCLVSLDSERDEFVLEERAVC